VPIPTSRALPILGAFVCGLVLVFGAIVYFAGRPGSPIGPAIAAVGGPFHLEDQNGTPVSDQDMKREPFLAFFLALPAAPISARRPCSRFPRS
jgi:cytochrome oxidase Cu insertion factor (SCO1/SenC/PrrC family)